MARGIKTSKKKNTDTWWDQQTDTVRPELVNQDKLRKRAKKLRFFVWAAVVLAPLSMFMNLAFLTSNTNDNAGPRAAADQFKDTRSAAMIAVRTWLSQDPSPLPGGSLVGWDRATKTKFVPPENNTSNETPYESTVHYLTVATPDGSSFTTTVTVLYDAEHGPVAVGTPALIPVAPADTAWDANPYPKSTPVTLQGDAVLSAVNDWAAAYTSGDPARLQGLVGDKAASHFYVPLAGASLSELGIVGEAYEAAGNDAIFVRVEGSIEWAYAPVGEDSTTFAKVSFDLLVEDASTAAPRVVAWGGPGTGPALKRFGNAEIRSFTPSELPSESPNAETTDPATSTPAAPAATNTQAAAPAKPKKARSNR